MGRTRHRKPRNSATFQLCPRPGAADASDRVLVRVDGNPYYLPGFADDDGDYNGYDGNSSSSTSAAGALPEDVRREILELGLPDDGYNYLTHIRDFRPSFSSTGGGGSSAAFIPSRRPARPGLSVKAYDARGVKVGTDNIAAAVVVAPIEEVIDPDVTELLEESDVPQGTSEDVTKHSDVPQGTVTNLLEESGVPQGTSEEEESDEDFVLIANQSEEEEQMDLEDDFVILANQLGEEEFDGAWSMLADEQIKMLSLGAKSAQKSFA